MVTSAEWCDWFDEDEWVPEFAYCHDCAGMVHYRDTVQMFDGTRQTDEGEQILTALVCFECAILRGDDG